MTSMPSLLPPISNLTSPSGATKICVCRWFIIDALISLLMQPSHRINFGPLRFGLCKTGPPQVMHFVVLSFFICWVCCCCCCCCWWDWWWCCCWWCCCCWCCCCCWWWWCCEWSPCTWSIDSEATIWICAKFWPFSFTKLPPIFWLPDDTIICCCSALLLPSVPSCVWMRLWWFNNVKWENIKPHTSHLKLMFEIVFVIGLLTTWMRPLLSTVAMPATVPLCPIGIWLTKA